MNYSIQYQYRPKGNARPTDDGERLPVKANDETILPSIGDHVSIGATLKGQNSVFGVVASRLFCYQQTDSGEVFCNVNIVLDECRESIWPTLIKE